MLFWQNKAAFSYFAAGALMGHVRPERYFVRLLDYFSQLFGVILVWKHIINVILTSRINNFIPIHAKSGKILSKQD